MRVALPAALRASAVLAVVLGVAAAPRPALERVQDSRESPAVAMCHAGKRGEAPAIRTGARPERRPAQALIHALPAAAAALRRPPVVGAVGFERSGGWTSRPRARSNGARAPPPTA